MMEECSLYLFPNKHLNSRPQFHYLIANDSSSQCVDWTAIALLIHRIECLCIVGLQATVMRDDHLVLHGGGACHRLKILRNT